MEAQASTPRIERDVHLIMYHSAGTQKRRTDVRHSWRLEPISGQLWVPISEMWQWTGYLAPVAPHIVWRTRGWWFPMPCPPPWHSRSIRPPGAATRKWYWSDHPLSGRSHSVENPIWVREQVSAPQALVTQVSRKILHFHRDLLLSHMIEFYL